VRDRERQLKAVERLALFKVSRVRKEEVKSIVEEGEDGLS
jgi:hypothetical protein